MYNISYLTGNIADAKADVIVNAANGVGYLGGKKAIRGELNGVSESLNQKTNGALERVSLFAARKNPHISSWFYGYNPGEYFVTDACGLSCKKVFHAVTMRFPGMPSKEKYIHMLLSALFIYCIDNNYHSVAIPLLGCGTGGLDKQRVKNMILKKAENYKKYIEVQLYE